MTVAEIYDELKASLHRYALRLTRDSDQADDLVQETFIRAVSNLELLGQLNLHQRQAWAYRVLKNLFLDAQNARRRERALIEQLACEVPFTTHTWADMELAELLDHVPERYRELLRKRYLLGMTSEQIAHELDIPAATVRSRLHLAIKRLRSMSSRFA